MIICYTFPEIWHVKDVFIFHFGLFSALLHPPAPSPQQYKKSRFKKNEKNPRDIIILHICTKNHD